MSSVEQKIHPRSPYPTQGEGVYGKASIYADWTLHCSYQGEGGEGFGVDVVARGDDALVECDKRAMEPTTDYTIWRDKIQLHYYD